MNTQAMKWTDKELEALEKRIEEAYERASKEVTEKMERYLERFAKQDAVMTQKLQDGLITKKEYTTWRTNHFMMGKNWEAMRDTLTEDLVNADKIASKMINESLINVYAENANYEAYQIEKDANVGLSFSLYDKKAVENLLSENPNFIPAVNPKIPMDERWNRQHITSEMLQGIMQGESIPKIANRMATVVGMEKNSAIRNARTYTTSVENKAKMDRYEEAEEMGIDLEKEWMATLDERTRESHRELDGERVANDEPFSNGLMYPADPSGDPAEVYNCRCRIVPRIKGRQYDRSGRANKLGDMSYEEWKRGKEKEEKQTAEENTIKEVANKAEALESLKVTFTDVDEEVMKLNEELLVDNVNQFNKLNSRFGVVKANDGSYFSTNNTKHIAQASGGYRDGQYEISLSNKYYKKIDVYHEQYDRGQQSGWKMPSSDDYRNTYTITHEYGHILEGYVSRSRTDFDAIKADIESTWGHNPKVIPRYLNDAYNKSEKNLAKDIRNEIVDIAKSNNKNFDLESNLSKYGHTNDYEFFAEVFANSQCGNPNELGNAMQQWLAKEGF